MSNEMRGLDRWITGSYGEDQFKNDLPEVEDEGATMLQDAIDYLESSQPFKELVFCYCDAVSEAVDIMDTARVNCLRQQRGQQQEGAAADHGGHAVVPQKVIHNPPEAQGCQDLRRHDEEVEEIGRAPCTERV